MFDTFKIKRKPIYVHTHLDAREVNRMLPLVESAFKSELGSYGPTRKNLRDERLKFAATQYANRVRISKNMGVNPLTEDANLFESTFPNAKNLFESVSIPGNIIGMGDIVNPDSSSKLTGGIFNPDYKSGSGDVASYVFGLQGQIALNCQGFDLLPTIAVDTPKITVSFVDTVYGGGTFDDIDNLPSYVELSSSLFKRSWILSKSLKRATTEIVLIADNGNALKVRFVLGSTIKSAITVEVLETGVATIAAGAVSYVWDNSVTVKTVIDSINAEAGALAFTEDYLVEASGEAITKISVNYASATRQTIAEASTNNNKLGGMDRAQQEKGPKHKLNIIVMDKQLEMVGVEIDADTTNIQIKDMAAMGVNAISYLYTGIQNQVVQTLDDIIMQHLYRMGVTHAISAYESQGINHSLYIDVPTNATFDMDTLDVEFEDITEVDRKTDMGNIINSMLSTAYENQNTHGDRLYARLLVVLEFVAQQNRTGAPDFIVVGGLLAACLKKNSTFTACPVATNFNSHPELHYSGTIFETVNVYKNPKIEFNDPRILIGRRGDDTDSGSKFLAYDLASSRQTIDGGTMADKIRVWSRFQIADIGFYPELNYYTMVAINKYGWA